MPGRQRRCQHEQHDGRHHEPREELAPLDGRGAIRRDARRLGLPQRVERERRRLGQPQVTPAGDLCELTEPAFLQAGHHRSAVVEEPAAVAIGDWGRHRRSHADHGQRGTGRVQIDRGTLGPLLRSRVEVAVAQEQDAARSGDTSELRAGQRESTRQVVAERRQAQRVRLRKQGVEHRIVGRGGRVQVSAAGIDDQADRRPPRLRDERSQGAERSSPAAAAEVPCLHRAGQVEHGDQRAGLGACVGRHEERNARSRQADHAQAPGEHQQPLSGQASAASRPLHPGPQMPVGIGLDLATLAPAAERRSQQRVCKGDQPQRLAPVEVDGHPRAPRDAPRAGNHGRAASSSSAAPSGQG